MSEDPRQPSDAQKEAVRALIGRLQPGEILEIGERPVARYYYARIIPAETRDHDQYLEQIWPDYEAVIAIQTMIESLVKAGDLVETGYRWRWTKPISARGDQP